MYALRYRGSQSLMGSAGSSVRHGGSFICRTPKILPSARMAEDHERSIGVWGLVVMGYFFVDGCAPALPRSPFCSLLF